MIRNLTSGYITQRNEIHSLNRYLHSRVHCNIIYNSQDTETTKMPTDIEQIRKLWYTCTTDYNSVQGKQILPFATAWMNLEDIMINKISLTEKDKYCLIFLTCGI